ncbi:ATP-binding protein [Limibacter armeniacum]|uniref:sensor histidine kinase n=1 Tax=Limibacter armeniacum TaxID=466084 RepID=UPI002FE5DBAA
MKDKHYNSQIRWVAYLMMVAGILVMFGWIIDFKPLLSVVPGLPTMKFNTALCFFLSGATLVTVSDQGLYLDSLNRFFSTLVFLIGGLTLIEHALDRQFGIDEIFVKDQISIVTKYSEPGRMSTATSFCFVLFSSAFILFKFKRGKTNFFGQLLLHLVTIISMVSFISYLYGVPVLSKLSIFTSMAIHTSLMFVLLSIAASLVHYRLGATARFTGNGIGNELIRRMFPTTLTMVLILGLLQLQAIEKGWISAEFGIALFVISYLLAHLFLLFSIVDKVNVLDRERKKVQEQFKTVVESTPNALLLMNQDGFITMVNREAEELFGYNRDELVGIEIEQLMPEEFRQDHPVLRNDFYKDPKARPMGKGRVLFALRKNKERVPVEIGLSPIENDGKTMVLASIIDISERIMAEEIIKRHSKELEAKNKELEQFAYIASHDLQEPLNTVIGFTSILEEHFQDDEYATKRLMHISRSSNRMLAFIRALLDYSRLGRNAKLEDVDCNQLLESLVADLNNLISTTETKVTIDKLPVLKAYSGELRMLFQNLITNAIKFRKPEDTAEIEISAERNGRMWQFSVQDNGIGIPEEHQEHIFEIFQRLHRRDEIEGTGIGLAHCKKIVDLHNGKVWVTSEVGVGSTFYFTIDDLGNTNLGI